MQVVHSRPVRRCHDDGGSALLEAAFLTPVFFLLLFGILEYGLVFRDYLTMTNGTMVGSRMASIQGNSTDADLQIIKAVKKGTGAVNRNTIRSLVVWKAVNAQSTIPAACSGLTASTTIQSSPTFCNVYTPGTDWDAVDNPAFYAYYTCAAATDSTRSSGYCAGTRKIGILSTQTSPFQTGPDYLGVTLEFNHRFVTKLFGSSIVIKDTTITQLEPQEVQ